MIPGEHRRELLEDVVRDVVVPGNHDVPLSDPAARMFRPLARFEQFFPGQGAIVTKGGKAPSAASFTVN